MGLESTFAHALSFEVAYFPPTACDLGITWTVCTFGKYAQLAFEVFHEFLDALLSHSSFLHEACCELREITKTTLSTSAAVLFAFSSRLAFSSGLRTSRPLASRGTSPPLSSSWRADFMSLARLISPIIGMKRSPPKIAPKTSSGSTYPPCGALSLGPNSLYFLRSPGSASVW